MFPLWNGDVESSKSKRVDYRLLVTVGLFFYFIYKFNVTIITSRNIQNEKEI